MAGRLDGGDSQASSPSSSRRFGGMMGGKLGSIFSGGKSPTSSFRADSARELALEAAKEEEQDLAAEAETKDERRSSSPKGRKSSHKKSSSRQNSSIDIEEE